MLETFQKIWKFAGDERDNINKSIVFCFINAVFGMFEIAAVYLAVRALTGEGSRGRHCVENGASHCSRNHRKSGDEDIFPAGADPRGLFYGGK